MAEPSGEPKLARNTTLKGAIAIGLDECMTAAYMRTIMHTMAHVRQIWYLRGLMGISDRAGFPYQHWA